MPQRKFPYMISPGGTHIRIDAAVVARISLEPRHLKHSLPEIIAAYIKRAQRESKRFGDFDPLPAFAQLEFFAIDPVRVAEQSERLRLAGIDAEVHHCAACEHDLSSHTRVMVEFDRE
jgi:hypothetical protein